MILPGHGSRSRWPGALTLPVNRKLNTPAGDYTPAGDGRQAIGWLRQLGEHHDRRMDRRQDSDGHVKVTNRGILGDSSAAAAGPGPGPGGGQCHGSLPVSMRLPGATEPETAAAAVRAERRR